MLKSAKNKTCKLNRNKLVRETINLNKQIDSKVLVTNTINDWAYLYADINLTNHLNTTLQTKKGKIIIKWWEN